MMSLSRRKLLSLRVVSRPERICHSDPKQTSNSSDVIIVVLRIGCLRPQRSSLRTSGSE